MGSATGFRDYERKTPDSQPAHSRVASWTEFSIPLPVLDLERQGARCMDCGVPFCQSNAGCPLGNRVPEWNGLVHEGRWEEALKHLHATNNFPEFTGRVCPAPCESACVLGIHSPPVAIKSIEQALADRGFDEGWIRPRPASRSTGRRVAIVGSGPAGLAAAQQLVRLGHAVTVYERDDRVGGLLTYGIPSMKLGKDVVERRVDQLRREGIVFRTGVEIGVDLPMDDLVGGSDAVLLCTGATVPRDLEIPGRSLDGVHFAMDYLTSATRALLGGVDPVDAPLSAHGRHVIVIGGGDTGNDCIATAVRQGAASVSNFEIRARPPEERASDNPWPEWPWIFQMDYGHAEAEAVFGEDPRSYQLAARRFEGDAGRVEWVCTTDVSTPRGDGSPPPDGASDPRLPARERRWRADLVLLAMGFVGAEALAADLRPGRGLPATGPRRFATPAAGVFIAGDCRRGQSLVVSAIEEGRSAAAAIHAWLAGRPVAHAV